MARHDRGRGLAERACFHLVGKVGDDFPIHLKVDFDGRSAQSGMRSGAGVGVRQTVETRYVSGQFDDAFVVDVVQHKGQTSAGATRWPWRPGFTLLYMGANGGKTASPASSGVRRKFRPVCR